MPREGRSARGEVPAPDHTLDLAQPGVPELLRNQRALSVWEVLRRNRRAAARSEVAQQLGLSEPETQKDIDLLSGFGLVERVPASRHLRAGGYRVTCVSIVVLIDPQDARYQPLVSSILEHVSERSIEIIRRQNRSSDTVFRKRIKRAFSWLHVNEEEFEQVRMMLRSFDALIKRIEARQLRNPSPPSERPNLHLALCVTPLDGEALPMPPLEVTTREQLERNRGVQSAQGMEQLSPREREVIMLLLGGRTEKEAAESLGPSPGTVRTHVVHAYEKLGVKRRSELSARVLGLST
jgi:DNA-binding CsgD family transcriptional regulator/DNA-binding Lrp family transcriptional regulator